GGGRNHAENARGERKNDLTAEREGGGHHRHKRITLPGGAGVNVGQELQMNLGSLQKLAGLGKRCRNCKRRYDRGNNKRANCFHREFLLPALCVQVGPVTWGVSAGASGPRYRTGADGEENPSA